MPVQDVITGSTMYFQLFCVQGPEYFSRLSELILGKHKQLPTAVLNFKQGFSNCGHYLMLQWRCRRAQHNYMALCPLLLRMSFWQIKVYRHSKHGDITSLTFGQMRIWIVYTVRFFWNVTFLFIFNFFNIHSNIYSTLLYYMKCLFLTFPDCFSSRANQRNNIIGF